MNKQNKSPAADKSKQGHIGRTYSANGDPSHPTIKGARDGRFIGALINGDIPIRDLSCIAGAANVWDLCSRMRKRGWRIVTSRRSSVGRDGRKVSVAYYSLDSTQKIMAIKALYLEGGAA